MLTVGSTNRRASAGVKKAGVRPRPTSVPEPSAFVVSFPDADAFSVIALPVLRFVYDWLNLPVTSSVMDPSAVLKTLMNSLLATGSTRTLNPQNRAGRVKVGDERPAICGSGRPGPERPSPLLRLRPASRRAPRSLQIASWRTPLCGHSPWPAHHRPAQVIRWP